jgi:hypothetical protein
VRISFPSTGVWITMIEAMACGTPVIAMSHGVDSRGHGRGAHRVHLPIHGRDARVGAEDRSAG